MYKYILFLVLISASKSFAQKQSNWNNYSWLLGKWEGEGNGQPGQGSGTDIFKFDLDQKILIRSSNSTYPATNSKLEINHSNLLITYLDELGNPTKAIYFDNEGHTINYNVTFLDHKIVYISDKNGNNPIFRLTYSKINESLINTKFEMSQDGKTFFTYIEGNSKLIK